MVVDEDEPVVNQSIVREVVEASQGSFSQDLCKSLIPVTCSLDMPLSHHLMGATTLVNQSRKQVSFSR